MEKPFEDSDHPEGFWEIYAGDFSEPIEVLCDATFSPAIHSLDRKAWACMISMIEDESIEQE